MESESNKNIEELYQKQLNESHFEYISNKLNSLKTRPSLAILIPCYGGLIHLGFHTSIIETIKLFSHLNLECKQIYLPNDSLISRSRNNLIAKALSDKTTTHVLFIDTDIVWNPFEILKLLIADKYLVGGIYPLKKYNWEYFSNPNFQTELIERRKKSALQTNTNDQNFLQYLMVKYNTNLLPGKKIIDGLVEVKHLPTGFMMIKVEAIHRMIKAFPYLKYVDDVGFLSKDENEYAYTLFDTCVVDEHLYSEDWTFCHRWTQIGGKCYANMTISLTHIGVEEFKGSFVDYISLLTCPAEQQQQSPDISENGNENTKNYENI